MALKANMPDFIDDSSGHEVSDVSGWGKSVAGLVVGTGLATVGVGLGYSYGRRAQNWLQNTASGASSGASGSNGGFDFS